MEVMRIPRVGGISISSTESGVLKPAVTETLRIGLTLRSIETLYNRGSLLYSPLVSACNLSVGREFAALRVY
jgi:hypothetical protein